MAYKPLPDASYIRVEGSLDNRFRMAMKRLTEGSEYTKEFLLADVTGDYWRVFTEYCGDISGRYIGAVGLGRTYTREPYPLVDEVAQGIANAQREDGHFLTEQPLDAINYPLAYGHGRLLKGLVEYYTVSPHPAILQTIRRLTDYFCATAPYWRKPEVIQNEEFIYYTQILEGVVGAYRLTREDKYLALGRTLADLLWKEPKHHSHSYLSSLLGVLALYEVTGEQPYLQFVAAKRDEIARMVTVDGGVTEMLPKKHVTEYCSVADWFMLHLGLWRVTHQTHYLEAAERILLNAVYFNQFSTGGFGTWRVDTEHGYRGRVEAGSWEAYWCCCFHGVRSLYEALTHAYTWDEESVRINFFFPSTLQHPGSGHFILRQEGDYPNTGYACWYLFNPERMPITLWIRIPSWAHNPVLKVNGEVTAVDIQDGYMALCRTWGSADVVELRFDMGLRLEDQTEPIDARRLPIGAVQERVSLWWGPLLLGIDEMFNATGPSDDKNSWTAPDHLFLPPFENGVCVLPRGRELLVPLEWPEIRFQTLAARSYSGDDVADLAAAAPVVLTPLARVPKHQPHCAPSVRTRYAIKIVSQEDANRILRRA